MARLADSAGRLVEIEPLYYYLADMNQRAIDDQAFTAVLVYTGGDGIIRVPWEPNDLDANWLITHIVASNGQRRWEHTNPVGSFETFDLYKLVSWVRWLGAGRGLEPLYELWDSMESDLSLQAEGTGESTRLTVNLGAWTFSRPMSDEEWVEFPLTPTRGALEQFAIDLARELAPFPIRVAEVDGVSSRYLQREPLDTPTGW